jgi:hypothetical protein
VASNRATRTNALYRRFRSAGFSEAEAGNLTCLALFAREDWYWHDMSIGGPSPAVSGWRPRELERLVFLAYLRARGIVGGPGDGRPRRRTARGDPAH